MTSICYTYEQAGVRAIPKHNQEFCPQAFKEVILTKMLMEKIIFKQIFPFEDKSTSEQQKVKSQQWTQLSHINKKCSENKKFYSQAIRELRISEPTTTVSEAAAKAL